MMVFVHTALASFGAALLIWLHLDGGSTAGVVAGLSVVALNCFFLGQETHR